MQLSGGSNDDLTPVFSGACASSGNRPPVITNFSCSETLLNWDDFQLNLYGAESVTRCNAIAADPEGGDLSYSYDYGDGTTPTSAKTHSYENTQTYTVTVNVSDGELTSSASIEHSATGNGPLPEPEFSCTQDKLTLTCDASASTGAVQYAWESGDIILGFSPVISYTFSAYGTYDIRLSVSNSVRRAVKTKSVTLVDKDREPQPPVASFTWQPDYCASGRSIVKLDASTTVDPDSTELTYQWEYIGASPIVTTLPNAEASFMSGFGQLLLVTLTVTDADGLSDSISQEIQVPYPIPYASPPPAPIYNLEANTQSGPAPLQVIVTGSEPTDGSEWKDVRWWIDDIAVSEKSLQLSHIFQTPGTHTITSLVSYVYDKTCGRISTGRDTLEIEVTSSQQGAQCEYLVVSDWGSGFTAEVRLSNTSDQTINGWQAQWTYGDGTKITNAWGGTLTGSDPYVATNSSWNRVIQPGNSLVVGVQGVNGSSSAKAPELQCSFQ